MPGVSGVTVVTCLRAFYLCTQGCGRIGRPAFPVPSFLRGTLFLHNSGALRGENAKLHPAVIAMTMWGCIRGCLKFESECMIERWLGRRTNLAAHGSLAGSVFAIALLGLRRTASCVAAPREARKGEAWCPWPESNQHSLRNSILSRARLPIPPQGPSDARHRAGIAKRAEYSGRRLPVNP
jgi:hypothetical protein